MVCENKLFIDIFHVFSHTFRREYVSVKLVHPGIAAGQVSSVKG